MDENELAKDVDKTNEDIAPPSLLDLSDINIEETENQDNRAVPENNLNIENDDFKSLEKPEIQHSQENKIPLEENNIDLKKSPNQNTFNIPEELQSETKSEEEPQKESKVKKILFFIVTIIFVFVFVYLFLNFPALWAKITYFYKEQIGEKPEVQTIIPESENDDLLFLSIVSLYDKPKSIEKLPTKEELGSQDLNDNELYVPKIDVKAPVIWDVSPLPEENMLDALKNGLAHYKGTAKPGESSEDGEGNVFVSGHSSYYWWDDGNYKTVFANLDQMSEGDEIAVGYEEIVYVYRVYEKTIVSPEEVSVLNQDTDKHILSLMTCYPVGTNSKRLIVKAELVARGTDNEEKAVISEDEISADSQIATTTTTTTEPMITTTTEEVVPTITVTPTTPSTTTSTQTSNSNPVNILPWN